ncbi:mitochondrial dna helicase [Phaffia rhodozyma]|uniref:ATP-dependent DNA helicase n=1 Tax=Phaffia rhodozyma TaxID=264483 RepID=A0A0F7SLK3_PHARH|nr:mitochondrial dna helicase [Phaffia rhodozyma]
MLQNSLFRAPYRSSRSVASTRRSSKRMLSLSTLNVQSSTCIRSGITLLPSSAPLSFAACSPSSSSCSSSSSFSSRQFSQSSRTYGTQPWKNPSQQASTSNAQKASPSLAEGIQGLHLIKNEIQHTLSDEQAALLNKIVRTGINVFFTGSAGTGKSYLLSEIVKQLEAKGKSVFVTSSTGISASNIGGVTVHSFAGINLGQEEVHVLANNINRPSQKTAKKRWMDADVLIIDEVSMIDGNLFDKLEEVARVVRGDSRVFGGLQVIITGDFYQLPPIEGRDSWGRKRTEVKYAFEAKSWDKVVDEAVKLTRVFRQTDSELISHLNKLREGRCDPDTTDFFQSLEHKQWEESNVMKLLPTRRQVEKENLRRLTELKDDLYRYQAVDLSADIGLGRFRLVDVLDAESHFKTQALNKLDLKVGAQIMVIQNMIPGRVVNGTLGTVHSFLTVAEVQEINSRDRSIHILGNNNNRGTDETLRQLLPAYKIDDSLSDLHRDRPNVLQMLEPMLEQDESMKFPVINVDGHLYFVQPRLFTLGRRNTAGSVEPIVARYQLPLIIGYALTIHKAQGQTIDRVQVNCAQMFALGQAYVAISRAKSLAGLQVINFHPTYVTVNKRVQEWMSKIRPMDVSDTDEVNSSVSPIES